MQQTNIGSSSSLCMAAKPDAGNYGFGLCKSDMLMEPGKPEPYSRTFRVSCDSPVGIQAWGLQDGDSLMVEQILMTEGKPGSRHKCCFVPGEPGKVAIVQPLQYNCEQVCLTACRDYIIIDKPGMYRLGWAIEQGCQMTAFGDVLVQKVSECKPVDPARRGYGNSLAEDVLTLLQAQQSCTN